MQNLRQTAWLPSQVRNLPHLLQGACPQGPDSGREKGQLVKLSKGGNGMQITDTIADLLTRIRNANSAKHDSVEIPASNMKKAIVQILADEGYVKNYTVIEDGKQGIIKVNLKYGEGKTPVIKGLRRVSKPGLRIYSNAEELPRVLKGLGIAVISTSRGVMTDRQARKENIGGEVLAFIW
jgi:small subunit ribosomal protein S8